MRSTRPGWRRTHVLASLVALFALAHGGCTAEFAEDSQATVILRILEMEAEAGDDPQPSAFLNSDVRPIFNDNVTITVEALPKNPNVAVDAFHEDVLVQRYEVNYRRSDGQNREGIDVPYRITGGVSTLVPYGDDAEVVFVVVRHQAKFEPPLTNLAGPGGVVLTVVAEITLHGQTTSGRAVTARGFLTINFADFSDTSN
jgi:hypothetical protein